MGHPLPLHLCPVPTALLLVVEMIGTFSPRTSLQTPVHHNQPSLRLSFSWGRGTAFITHGIETFLWSSALILPIIIMLLPRAMIRELKSRVVDRNLDHTMSTIEADLDITYSKEQLSGTSNLIHVYSILHLQHIGLLSDDSC